MSDAGGARPANDRVYIHELIDIRGTRRADYMHHMAANWSPNAQEDRDQLCYGVWAVLGSTGRWPMVCNLWEEAGWSGLAASFAGEAVGPGLQDPKLERWWRAAAEFRRGGLDRILVPAPWTRTITELLADGVRGECYAHETIRVRPGAAPELLETAREVAAPAHADAGWELAGAFTTALRDDDEAVLLWACPTWAAWAEGEAAHRDHDGVLAWRRRVREVATDWERIVLVDSALSPMRTGRQPSRDDRVDWQE